MNRKCVVQTRFCGQLTPRASRVIALKLTRGVSCSGVEGDGSETFIGQVPEAELMFDRFDRRPRDEFELPDQAYERTVATVERWCGGVLELAVEQLQVRRDRGGDFGLSR